MPGSDITGAIFIVCQSKEKFYAINTILYMAFIYLDKAYHRAPISRELNKLGLEQWLVLLIQSIHADARSKSPMCCGYQNLLNRSSVVASVHWPTQSFWQCWWRLELVSSPGPWLYETPKSIWPLHIFYLCAVLAFIVDPLLRPFLALRASVWGGNSAKVLSSSFCRGWGLRGWGRWGWGWCCWGVVVGGGWCWGFGWGVSSRNVIDVLLRCYVKGLTL